MDEAEQEAIEEHLQAWAYWYTRLNKMLQGEINFPTWEEEEQAGEAAWKAWDQVFDWLEAHGIHDADIVYDEETGQATLKNKPNN